MAGQRAPHGLSTHCLPVYSECSITHWTHPTAKPSVNAVHFSMHAFWSADLHGPAVGGAHAPLHFAKFGLALAVSLSGVDAGASLAAPPSVGTATLVELHPKANVLVAKAKA